MVAPREAVEMAGQHKAGTGNQPQSGGTPYGVPPLQPVKGAVLLIAEQEAFRQGKALLRHGAAPQLRPLMQKL